MNICLHALRVSGIKTISPMLSNTLNVKVIQSRFRELFSGVFFGNINYGLFQFTTFRRFLATPLTINAGIYTVTQTYSASSVNLIGDEFVNVYSSGFAGGIYVNSGTTVLNAVECTFYNCQTSTRLSHLSREISAGAILFLGKNFLGQKLCFSYCKTTSFISDSYIYSNSGLVSKIEQSASVFAGGSSLMFASISNDVSNYNTTYGYNSITIGNTPSSCKQMFCSSKNLQGRAYYYEISGSTGQYSYSSIVNCSAASDTGLCAVWQGSHTARGFIFVKCSGRTGYSMQTGVSITFIECYSDTTFTGNGIVSNCFPNTNKPTYEQSMVETCIIYARVTRSFYFRFKIYYPIFFVLCL